MAEFLLMPFGSAGDVFPFIGLGKHLARRGHAVKLVANGYFRPHAKAAGLPFIEMWSKDAYLAALNNPDIWHPTRGFSAVVGHTDMPAVVEDQHQLIIEHFLRNPNIVVVAGSLAFGARIARETHGIRMATIHLSPSVILSVDKPNRLPTMKIPDWWPRSWIRSMYWLGNKVVIHPTMKRVVGNYRKELMLPVVKDYFRKWIHSTELVLGLWPDWFASPAPDWPVNMRLTSFPAYDGNDGQALSPDVISFLQKGSKPVIITFGSAMKLGTRLFTSAVESCHALQLRALVLTPFREQVPQPLPPGMLHVDFVPLSQVLPHAGALVHHGGIGTMANALRHGIPQFITPLAHDQFDNADRITGMTAGMSLPASKVTTRKLTPLLHQLITDQGIKQQVQRIAGQLQQEHCFDQCSTELEHLASRRASTRFYV
jgi:rhamnosyltransferase subunit B